MVRRISVLDSSKENSRIRDGSDHAISNIVEMQPASKIVASIAFTLIFYLQMGAPVSAYECSTSRDPGEKVLCSDTEASHAELYLLSIVNSITNNYGGALSVLPPTLQDQGKWERKSRAACGNSTESRPGVSGCVLRQTLNRIAELRARLARTPAPSPLQPLITASLKWFPDEVCGHRYWVNNVEIGTLHCDKREVVFPKDLLKPINYFAAASQKSTNFVYGVFGATDAVSVIDIQFVELGGWQDYGITADTNRFFFVRDFNHRDHYYEDVVSSFGWAVTDLAWPQDFPKFLLSHLPSAATLNLKNGCFHQLPREFIEQLKNVKARDRRQSQRFSRLAFGYFCLDRFPTGILSEVIVDGLQLLDLSHNVITEIGVAKIPDHLTLDLSFNKISSLARLPLAYALGERELYKTSSERAGYSLILRGNEIESLHIDQTINALDVSVNPLKKITFGPSGFVKTLNLSCTPIGESFSRRINGDAELGRRVGMVINVSKSDVRTASVEGRCGLSLRDIQDREIWRDRRGDAQSLRPKISTSDGEIEFTPPENAELYR